MPINKFYTLFWILYFPLCIAFYEDINFDYIDEMLTLILILFGMTRSGRNVNKAATKEVKVYLIIMSFYVVYSLWMAVNVKASVWLDLQQQIRPYAVFYTTWYIRPQFTRKQKKLMLGVMLATFIIYMATHYTQVFKGAEFPVMGQLAICTGMTYYIFTEASKRNIYISLLIVTAGLLSGKFKYFGEYVTFIAIIFFVKNKVKLTSTSAILRVALLATVVIFFTWTRFDIYYVSGMNNKELARPMTYKTSLRILGDYFPFGSGLGTFATNAAWKYYSPLYPKYQLDRIWGLDKGGGFIADAFYPTLAEFGIIGILLFCIFWKRRLSDIGKIPNLKYYKVALMCFFCLALESTADTSYLSGKGMGYFMLLAICISSKPHMKSTNQQEICPPKNV